jgi:hypothetical protein
MLAEVLDLEIYFLKRGAARIKINEKGSQRFGINSDMPGGAGVEEESLEYLENFEIDRSHPNQILISYSSEE